MNALIVDDEQQARQNLLQLIQLSGCPISQCEEADSLPSAIAAIEASPPDVLFLDINLGIHNGFELLQHFQDLMLPVIFVTGHNDYLLRALRASAVDFLLKPVRASELLAAVQKAAQKHNQQQYYQSLDTLFANIHPSPQGLKKLTINTSDSLYSINVEDIIYCVSDKGYTTFYTLDQQKIMVSKILLEYEELLPKRNFMRVHQSFLVNMDHVLRYDKKDKNVLVTKFDHRIPVSHRLKAKVLAHFHE